MPHPRVFHPKKKYIKENMGKMVEAVLFGLEPFRRGRSHYENVCAGANSDEQFVCGPEPGAAAVYSDSKAHSTI